jgi:hypothetical protein
MLAPGIFIPMMRICRVRVDAGIISCAAIVLMLRAVFTGRLIMSEDRRDTKLSEVIAEIREFFLDDKITVCITHKRFVPCRAEMGCVLSVDARDVEMVRRYHSFG